MEERKAKRMEERKAKRESRRSNSRTATRSPGSARRSPAARRKVNKSRTRR